MRRSSTFRRCPTSNSTALRNNIAVNGVLVPILVDSDGPTRRIIDGNYRKRIADELGYDCPEIVKAGLTDEEERTLPAASTWPAETVPAAAATTGRRPASRDSRPLQPPARQATPGSTHATVAAVRSSLEGTGQIIQSSGPSGPTGSPGLRPRRPPRPLTTRSERLPMRETQRSRGPGIKSPTRGLSTTRRPTPDVFRTKAERQARIDATTLIHGDCRVEMGKLARRERRCDHHRPHLPGGQAGYGRINEPEWHELMRAVVTEGRRVLKPKGSMVVILQPNYEAIGKMRLWLWEFVAWAGREWESRPGRLLVGHRCHAAGRHRPQVRPDAAVSQDVRLARPLGLPPGSG